MVSSFAPCPFSSISPFPSSLSSFKFASLFFVFPPRSLVEGGERNFSLENVFFSGSALCESFLIPISFS